MRNPKPRGSRLSSRPFYTTVFILTLLTTYSLFLRIPESNHQDESLLSKRSEQKECRDLHHAIDKCAFVHANCADDEAGLLSYLTLYYCDLGNAQPVAFIILVLWLGLLFSTIGIAASDFFSVNLSTIASILGLSESLAGVTFLAFGNGSPDVFSTFAAMGSNSASMAVGELIGAASFITAVVAGSMALVREFKVGRKTFVRDICFFIVAVAFTMVFLADGHLHLWECITMVCYYIFYVIVVVGWHWWSGRQRQKREREAAARGHVYGAVGNSNDELAPEPYRDDPDDTDRRVSFASANGLDISALEAGPRIEIDGRRTDEDDDGDSDRGKHLAAEMASSMRVLRPRGRRNTTITPIRPSLVGALEFRSALAQLQRERNLRLGPVNGRAYSDNHLDGLQGDNALAPGPTEQSRHTLAIGQGVSSGRERALSSGDIPPSFSSRSEQPLGNVEDHSHEFTNPFAQLGTRDMRTRSPSPAFQIGGSLAPPPLGQHPPRQETGDSEPSQPPVSPRLLQLQIPQSRRGSASERSSPISPFPGFTDSPTLLTPNPQTEPTEFMLPPGPVRRESSFPEFPVRSPRPVRWWPYDFLPPPHVLLSTMFPTLQGWKEKSIWDKFVSAISVPSIFLLVITLPVVETEAPDDLSDETAVDPPRRGSIGNVAEPVSVERNAEVEPETEWQQYRRATISHSIRSSQPTSPLLIALDSPNNTHLVVPDVANLVHSQPVKPGPAVPSESDGGQADDDSNGWNRWLVALQLFTGPLFAVFILWANWREDMEQPGMTLVKLTLYTLLGSTILLAILLLTTTPDRRPKYHLLLCFMGFIISIAWISTIAGEVVGVLKTFGVILGISEALLGLTIFAAGNSVGDLIADITVARLGYPVMALSACFGGPMLNILLGIGIGGVWMMTQAANQKHKKHPDRPFKYKPYEIQIGGTLLVSAITLLITLVGLLIVVPMNKWVMSRKIGWSLIAIWTVSTVVNVVVELTGVWSQVA